MSQRTILVVEDEASVANGVIFALEEEGFQVFWAQTGRQALDMVRMESPHLILLDIRLPDLNGYDICRTLRQEGKRMPILMVTARDEELDRVLGLELGADDYIVKPYSLRELIARVRAHLRRSFGDLSGSPASTEFSFGDILIDPNRIEVHRAGKQVLLTPLEFRLLLFLAENPGRVFSRSELIESIWGYDSSVGSDRTVDVHILHLRRKLEKDPENPEHILTVRGAGYRLVP
ncbi:MAG: response regulator transcription factor [Anaerolineales bacterium]|nr:response regulator transcription factor [Anaerolineales bacterium]